MGSLGTARYRIEEKGEMAEDYLVSGLAIQVAVVMAITQERKFKRKSRFKNK